MNKYCYNCGVELQPGTSKCHECGVKLPTAASAIKKPLNLTQSMKWNMVTEITLWVNMSVFLLSLIYAYIDLYIGTYYSWGFLYLMEIVVITPIIAIFNIVSASLSLNFSKKEYVQDRITNNVRLKSIMLFIFVIISFLLILSSIGVWGY